MFAKSWHRRSAAHPRSDRPQVRAVDPPRTSELAEGRRTGQDIGTGRDEEKLEPEIKLLLAHFPTLATICLLLYLEEAGVPLPITPGEAVLLGAGLLIASGAQPAWVVIPLAYA